MCRVPVFEFLFENVRVEEFKDRSVLEVGSKYVNGSIRPFIERFLRPREYIGIDIEPGKYVDIILHAEKLLEYFGANRFDIVISTETLEHIRDWRVAITNMKAVLKPEGYISQPFRGVSLTTAIHMTTGGMNRKICTKFFLTLKY